MSARRARVHGLGESLGTPDQPGRRQPPEPEAFLISVVSGPAGVTVAPSGPLDLITGEVLEAAVHRVYASEGRPLVLDLRGLVFLDSTGLRVLLSLRNDAKRSKRSLTLIPGPPGVRRIFTLTGTAGLFDWQEA